MNIDRIGIKGSADNDFVMLDTVYGLYPVWRSLSAPEPVTSYVKIPGMNGALDCSEEFGEVFYDTRELDIDCVYIKDSWHTDIRELTSKYHGREVKIKFTNDPGYYWSGRLFVKNYDSQDRKLTMTATVYPYRFCNDKTSVTISDNRSRIATLRNGRMPVVPEITVTAPVLLAWDTYSKSVAFSEYPATFTLAGLRLTEGEKEVTIVPQDSSFIVTFEYREGDL